MTDAETVQRIAKWLRHIDRLDEIPGARDLMPEKNPLWDASFAIEREFGESDPSPSRPEQESEPRYGKDSQAEDA